MSRNKHLVPLFGLLFLFLFSSFFGCSEKSAPVTDPTPKPQVETPAPTPEPENIEEELTGGDALLAKEKYDEALAYFEKKLMANPADVESRVKAGQAAVKSGKFPKADKLLMPVIESKQGGQQEALAWQYLAESAFEAGDKKRGAKIFADMRERYKDDPDNLRAMVMHEGNIYWKVKNYDKALSVFNELVKIGNRDQEPGVVLLIALVQKSAGRMDQSRKTFEKIIQNYGYQKNIVNEARLHLARYSLEMGAEKQGMALVEEAEKNGADRRRIASLRLEYGRQVAKGKKPAMAEKIFLDIIEKYKNDKTILNTARSDIGTYYIAMEKYQNAIDALTLVANESPDDVQKQWATESLVDLKSRLKIPEEEEESAGDETAKTEATPGQVK